MAKVKVQTITVDIDGKQIELTLEQARELQHALDGVLGKREFVLSSLSPLAPQLPCHQSYWWDTPYWTSTSDTIKIWTQDRQTASGSIDISSAQIIFMQ